MNLEESNLKGQIVFVTIMETMAISKGTAIPGDKVLVINQPTSLQIILQKG